MASSSLYPADRRIQDFLDRYLADVGLERIPTLPTMTFELDRHGVARELSLPLGEDEFRSEIVSSYRVKQGILHNPASDRRTTQGSFHVAEGGLPVPGDKKQVPKLTFALMLAQALQPPPELMIIPFTANQAKPARMFASLLLRPVVCPEIPGVAAEKSMEVRFFAPGNLVSNLDFVESIFGNGGNPALPECDAGLDVDHWSGHSGCVILAPHLIKLTKQQLGLPHWDEASERQREDGMCWQDPAELYNDGQAFKLTARDRSGVIVTLLADNYYGYCKKEVKTQISYAANLFGLAEEEHAGGALAFRRFNHGDEFGIGSLTREPGYDFDDMTYHYGAIMDVQPEGYAIDRQFPDIIYVPQDLRMNLNAQKIAWIRNGQSHSIRLQPGKIYIQPNGYKIEMCKHPGAPSWRLIGTVAEGTFCHKPCTVSGGGKSEISKSIEDAVIYGPLFVDDLQHDLDRVQEIFDRNYVGRFLPGHEDEDRDPTRSILSAERSLGSVIKLLTPSPYHLPEFNAWLKAIPPSILALVFLIKRFYRIEWGNSWRDHLSVDVIDGAPGHELKLEDRKIVATYLRVGFDLEGAWRTFKVRQDYIATEKVQMEDDISASVVVPAKVVQPWLADDSFKQSLKLVTNCEYRLFQRPDDAIIPGYDKATEANMAGPGNFMANFEPLDHAKLSAVVEDVMTFSKFTPPMQKLLGDAYRDGKGFVVSSAHPRLVGGKPSKNPRYLETRVDVVRPMRHHFALLAGYGAEAVCPWLTFETIKGMAADSYTANKNFVKAISKGLYKVMSKMGISTYQSYCGAQIFEAIGLNSEFVEQYFTGTATKIEGIGLDQVAEEAVRLHTAAFGTDPVLANNLDAGGEYAFRVRGEEHTWTPDSIAKLQNATRTGKFETYKEYAKLINDQARRHMTLRGLFEIKPAGAPIPLEQVESAKEIVKRFATGAMSLGSISTEAHATLAIAMNRIGGKSNTGEGGEDAKRFIPVANATSMAAVLGSKLIEKDVALKAGDSMRSSIKQVASGRFGVTAEYLANADQIQIKMAQGAKPGEGGQLPGHKVSEYIAKLRFSVPGVGLISPPPHHDIYSIEDLAQLIHDLKNANPKASISVKLVSETGVGTVAAGVAKAKSDHIVIAGHDGGTGASPISSIKHAGTPWELGLSETQQTLVLNQLRGRVIVQVDGQMKTGRDVVIGALLGADEFGFATAPLVVEGCIMMRKCHLNTCPVGVATQDPELRKRFTGQPEHVVNYFFFVAEEVRELMASMGIAKFEDLIGRPDLLDMQAGIEHWKINGLDFSKVFHQPDMPASVSRKNNDVQDHGLVNALDNKLVALAKPALEKGEKVVLDIPITNTNRTVGTMLSNQIATRYGNAGLPNDTIHVNFTGTSGQSFAAFLAKGITFDLTGEGNDYVGKGMCGGRIVIKPPKTFRGIPHENIIVGNTVMFGATTGESYFSGVAGERFCVRNSGATAVVEGVGNHGCEYMTGGTVVVLGVTGLNFAAGMSGGARRRRSAAAPPPRRAALRRGPRPGPATAWRR